LPDDDPDLAINTLYRFAKQPTKLVLHEYSHCEVPAGCGGVILRWIDPHEGEPCTVMIGGALGRVWLDGKELVASQALMTRGNHLVALELQRGEKAGPRQPWTFGIAFDDAEDDDVVSRGAPTWVATSEDTTDEWWDPAYDDDTWTALAPAPDDVLAALEEWPRRRLERARERGQAIFAFESPKLLVRLRFTAAGAAR